MTNQEIAKRILAALATLDGVSVSGRDNRRKMCSVEIYLQDLAEEVTKHDDTDKQGTDV